jgi:gluconate 2-dehydrogenase gamma chain
MAVLTRRDWMLAAACWSQVLRAQPKFATLDPATAAEIQAIAACIIPGDDTAGVIWFIDRALAGYDQDKRDVYTQGLAAMQARRAAMFPGSTRIAALSPAQQIALFTAVQDTEFFRLVRQHTILGFFAQPPGWKLMGIEHSMQFQPPFGYYDAERPR